MGRAGIRQRPQPAATSVSQHPAIRRQCACGPTSDIGACPACAGKPEVRRFATEEDQDDHETDETGGELDRRFGAGATGEAGRHDGPRGVPAIVADELEAGGSPLDPATRADMEARFGHDFSRVRVHAGPRAAASAQAIDARAYTLGHEVVFGGGEYTPQTHAGRRVLAHELAHVAAQGSARIAPRDAVIGGAGDPAETAADTTADRAMSGNPPVTVAHAPAVRRQPPVPGLRDPGAEAPPQPQPAEPPREESLWDEIERLLGELWRAIELLIHEVERVIRQWGTMPAPAPRSPAAPSTLPRGCTQFNTQADLDMRKAHWTAIIAAMPPSEVIEWIIGIRRPRADAMTEAAAQRDCLLAALTAAAPIGATAPVVSGFRDFTAQQRIWTRKFEFWTRDERRARDPNPRLRTAEFDRVSDAARAACGSLVGSATKWNPDDLGHRVCWNPPARAGAPVPAGTPPALPTGAHALSDDEKQQEILQASSAPGISRHHWGTDFDLLSVEPEEWEVGHTPINFTAQYAWLMRNASTYGFLQTFTATSTFMAQGYMEERWHWSYYPVAQALLEFARLHQTDIQTQLTAQWSTNPTYFSFISSHWRDYMFNVSETPVF
jgi:hypothetical protein